MASCIIFPMAATVSLHMTPMASLNTSYVSQKDAPCMKRIIIYIGMPGAYPILNHYKIPSNAHPIESNSTPPATSYIRTKLHKKLTFLGTCITSLNLGRTLGLGPVQNHMNTVPTSTLVQLNMYSQI